MPGPAQDDFIKDDGESISVSLLSVSTIWEEAEGTEWGF